MSKSGKAPGKSNFAQTCNLLSRYLKERASLADIGLGMATKLETKAATTMDLLSNMETSSEVLRQNAVAPSNVQSTDFLHQFGTFGPLNSMDIAEGDFRKPAVREPERAPMTIFYAGRVLILNEFPAEKAREIMALASKGSSSSGTVSAPRMDTVNSLGSMTPESTIVAASEKNTAQERLQQKPQAIASDLPMARRASLHRFLEKRKDRVAAKAPYQVYPYSQTPPKPKEINPWIELEGLYPQQLKLTL